MDERSNALPVSSGATLAGTEKFADRFEELHPSHFRLCHGLMFSSLGIGTYLGDADDATDARYIESIIRAAAMGCNVIDTAINYRFQRSERAIGTALRRLFENDFTRDEFIISTKGGFIPFDGSYPADPYQWIEENLLKKGIITPEEIHPSGHCIAPMYLYHQLEESLKNLGLEKVDIYYIHNPETQMSELNEPRFYEAVEMAFRALENAVESGKIGSYGVATWDGFLDNHGNGHVLQLERLVDCARRAGGDQHHFDTTQLPVNLTMTDALTIPNQKVGDRQMTFLEAARALDICVIGSASLLQQQLARNLPITLQQAIPAMNSDAARALQFARSVPGITTALVGMSTVDHVVQNMELAGRPIMNEHDFNIIFEDR